MSSSAQTIAMFTPRQQLNSKEIVLFDTRPHFIAIVRLRDLVWFVVGSALVPMVFAGIAEAVDKGATAWWAGLSWFFIMLLPLVARIVAWSHEYYSLTDQRILHGHGFISRSLKARQLARIGGMLDVSTYRITGVTFYQGFVGRIFNFGNIIFDTNRDKILWYGIKDPLNVRRLIEEKVAAFQEVGANQATYNEAVIRKVAEVKTEERFGLVEPKRNISMQDALGTASLQSSASVYTACSNCGSQESGRAAFCSQCGNRLAPA